MVVVPRQGKISVLLASLDDAFEFVIKRQLLVLVAIALSCARFSVVMQIKRDAMYLALQYRITVD